MGNRGLEYSLEGKRRDGILYVKGQTQGRLQRMCVGGLWKGGCYSIGSVGKGMRLE